MIYKYKEGWGGPVPAQVVGDRLETIRARYGMTTPRLVVQDAQDTRSPLHPCFTWDDALAADEHRKQQARNLMNRIIAVPVEAPESPPVRAFVAVLREDANERDYMPISAAMRDPAARSAVVAEALTALRQWRAKYRHLTELAQYFEMLDAIEAANV